jgi:hypothetical protein
MATKCAARMPRPEPHRGLATSARADGSFAVCVVVRCAFRSDVRVRGSHHSCASPAPESVVRDREDDGGERPQREAPPDRVGAPARDEHHRERDPQHPERDEEDRERRYDGARRTFCAAIAEAAMPIAKAGIWIMTMADDDITIICAPMGRPFFTSAPRSARFGRR